MSWVKHSDKRWSDARFTAMSDGAQALWFRADSYIADHLTDGFVSQDALRFLKTRVRYVRELVECGYWVWQESGGWLAADWQERIQCRDHVLARRSETLQRVRRHRNAVTNSVSNAAPGPGPDPVSERDLKPHLETVASVQPARRRPLPPEPADIPKMVPEIFRNPEPSAADLAAIRVWGIYLSTCGSAAFNKAPSAGELATCAEVVGWAASVEGVDLERATRELLRAWRSDDWVASKKPPFTNLSRNLLERDAPKAAAEIRKQLAEEKRANARPDAEVTERDPQLIRPSFAFIYGEGGTLDRRYDDPAAGAAYEDALRKRKGGSGEVAKGPVDTDRASGQGLVPRMVG